MQTFNLWKFISGHVWEDQITVKEETNALRLCIIQCTYPFKSNASYADISHVS